jgi:hypothetical protein
VVELLTVPWNPKKLTGVNLFCWWLQFRNKPFAELIWKQDGINNPFSSGRRKSLTTHLAALETGTNILRMTTRHLQSRELLNEIPLSYLFGRGATHKQFLVTFG